MRLNKFLALHTGISRREADDQIVAGKVTVDGTVALLGSQIHANEQVVVSGKLVDTQTKFLYVAFNKPRGYVCSRRKQGDHETIFSLLPAEYQVLKPVGRLDKDSSGLLLLTNDGDFAHQMTHPSFYKHKTYLVTLDHDLEPLHQQMINDFGIQLEDGPSKLTLERLNETGRTDWRVIMSEGRNRQIRRTFASLGYEVTELHRTNFGNYSLGDIKPGEYQEIHTR